MLLIQRSLERVGSLCSLDSAAAGTDILPTCFFQGKRPSATLLIYLRPSSYNIIVLFEP